MVSGIHSLAEHQGRITDLPGQARNSFVVIRLTHRQILRLIRS